MKTIAILTLAALVCGCAHVTPQTPTDPQITCKPKFQVRERQELHLMDAQGRERTAYRQWLILDDGSQQFRIAWGSPPLSRPPVDLYTHQTYTFTIRMETKSGTQIPPDSQIPKVIRVMKEAEVIYEAQE